MSKKITIGIKGNGGTVDGENVNRLDFFTAACIVVQALSSISEVSVEEICNLIIERSDEVESISLNTGKADK